MYTCARPPLCKRLRKSHRSGYSPNPLEPRKYPVPLRTLGYLLLGVLHQQNRPAPKTTSLILQCAHDGRMGGWSWSSEILTTNSMNETNDTTLAGLVIKAFLAGTHFHNK